MNQKSLDILDFLVIKANLAELASSNLGRKLAEELKPKTDPTAVGGMLRETSEARLILDAFGTPPFNGLADLSEPLAKVATGAALEALTLEAIGDFARGCRKTREFMLKRIEIAPRVTGYAAGLTAFPELEAEIERCISGGQVLSEAGPALKKIRREIAVLQDKIKAKLQQLLQSPDLRGCLQENIVCYRDGRPALMVKAACKQKVPGIVLGSSGSAGTLFVEPAAVARMNNEIQALRGAEEEEIYKILVALSGEVSSRLSAIERNLEIMAQYDLAFAKARLSRAMQGIEPRLNNGGRILLKAARHPLLEKAEPLDFYIGADYRSLVITGPNTGGKTVALKTVGLLTLMAQAGLHIPAGVGSEIAVFREVLADIGDGQSITQSLSTFSAHIFNIIGILKDCGPNSLVLLDEVGVGTDPVEGAALAVAILESLYRRGAITVATTHYPEIKKYALENNGFKNGCMEFDRINLCPLYRLIIGRPGESNALWIAEKLGMPAEILKAARRRAIEEAKSDAGNNQSLPPPAIIPAETGTNFIADSVKEGENGGVSEQPAEKTVSAIKVGDLVAIPFLREKGVVAALPDARGRIKVQIKDKKMEIPIKRVKLLISAEELYPEDYDLDIVFLSKADRKIKHRLSRKHAPGTVRVIAED